MAAWNFDQAIESSQTCKRNQRRRSKQLRSRRRKRSRGLMLESLEDRRLLSFSDVELETQLAEFMTESTWWALKSQRDMAIDEPISNVMHLGSHNAFNTQQDGFALFPITGPNQIFNMPNQLSAGSRVLELDIHELNILGVEFAAPTLMHTPVGGNLSGQRPFSP